MKNLIYLSISCLLVVSACKKKDDAQPDTSSTSTTGATTGGTPAPVLSPSVNVMLTVTSVVYEISGYGNVTSYSSRAYFSNTPQSSEVTAAGVRVAKVTLNGDSLSFSAQNS